MTSGVTLRPPRNRYDPRTVGWWRTQLAIATAVVVVPLVVLGVLIAPARTWLLLPAAVVGVIGLAATVALPIWWHRVHRWEITDHAVYALTGYFWRTWRVAPMSRIQTVDTTRGPVQGAFGLATLVVTTASSAGAVKLEGLDAETAAELAAELTRLTDATPGDAT
ncbi:membrane-flanked domain protein [Beutenbergia cavernae DSM 12333]|uniref:Membrane-flanked domain protein n=1 Tax=Beutenbergia cavernae (strain ATCC BAA-8 / DSM 12333 / CCUG 43141 / JCM 11478 / NBRC 16432 / NCIMB 13614 / HKI 0122) TaxID=471853 RepID=C5C1E4_BEUC1|nr:PH domain-containing protein [Beutenbergia cavernae]ACQ81554.1 membrane-flanked domain protein [Beutenbergia cavernae DSM 12333]